KPSVVGTSGVSRNYDALLILLGDHALRQDTRQFAFRALYVDLAFRKVHSDPRRDQNRALPYARKSNCFGTHHQTSQISSPPTFLVRASLSVISPCEVLIIETPKPFSTRGILSCPTYTRRPGLEIR